MRSLALAPVRPARACRLGFLFLLAVAAGCGPARGKVSGRVLYDGSPLPGGQVMFRPEDPREKLVTAVLDEQGQYEAILPAGVVQVSVDNRQLEPHERPTIGLPLGAPLSPDAEKALKGPPPDSVPPPSGENVPPKPRGTYKKIPARYYAIEKSGLQFTVTGGDQKQDIELTP